MKNDATPSVGHRGAASLLVAFRVLRHSNYRYFWTGLIIAVFGQTMEYVSMGWLVLQLTNSPLGLGLTGLAQTVPRVTLVLVGGVIADRVDRRRLLVGTQFCSGVLYLVMASLVVAGSIQVWQVYVISFLLGGVRAFDNPARQALLPLMIPREQIPSAVALSNIAWESPRLLGPALAGILISLIGVGNTLFVSAGLFFTSAALYLLIRVGQVVAKAQSSGMLGDIAAGFRFIRSNEIFYVLMGLTFFNSVFGMSYTVLLPVVARDLSQVGSGGRGVLGAVAGCGSFLGSLVAASLLQSGRKGRTVVYGAGIFGTLIVGFALSPWFVLALGVLFIAAMVNNVYMASVSTSLQLRVPDEYRARVMGVWSLTWSLVTLGGTISGSVAEFLGPRVAIALGGVIVVAGAAYVAVAFPRVRTLD